MSLFKASIVEEVEGMPFAVLARLFSDGGKFDLHTTAFWVGGLSFASLGAMWSRVWNHQSESLMGFEECLQTPVVLSAWAVLLGGAVSTSTANAPSHSLPRGQRQSC